MPFLRTAPNARPEAIIFDVGRVIIGVDTARALAFLGQPTGLSAAQIWKALEPTPEWRDWQEGRLLPGEFLKLIRRTLGYPIGFEELRAAWNSMLEPQPLLPDRLFENLALRSRLALLSNTDPFHSAYVEANYSFVRYFPVRVYSCGVGSSKPDPAIYRRALQELAVAPERTLFIDDVYENAAAADELGIAALYSTSTDEIVRQLARFE